MPAPSPPMYAHFTSSHARRGAFATRHLWVTPHSDDEKWPAGEYPLQREDDERARGLVHWTNQVGLTAASPKWRLVQQQVWAPAAHAWDPGAGRQSAVGCERLPWSRQR